MTNTQISLHMSTQPLSCPLFVVARTPAGCARKSATWTCCRPRSTQPRSCTSSGIKRGPVETPVVAPGATKKSDSHHTHHVALWVNVALTLVVCLDSVVSSKP